VHQRIAEDQHGAGRALLGAALVEEARQSFDDRFNFLDREGTLDRDNTIALKVGKLLLRELDERRIAPGMRGLPTIG
jgi:hypothetical protein